MSILQKLGVASRFNTSSDSVKLVNTINDFLDDTQLLENAMEQAALIGTRPLPDGAAAAREAIETELIDRVAKPTRVRTSFRRRYNRGHFEFPPMNEMMRNLEQASDTALQTMLDARKSGTLADPKTGESVSIDIAACSLEEMAFLHWIATKSRSQASVEIGFGLGMSAAAILAGRTGEHITMDPELLGGRGELPLRILARDGHTHIRLWSQIALPQLVETHAGACDLIFIDGDHRFDYLMSDFIFADKLCAIGGYIVFDDAEFPPVESVISFVWSNRDDYDIADLVADGLTVLRKRAIDGRSWDHFCPFEIPQRSGWKSRS